MLLCLLWLLLVVLCICSSRRRHHLGPVLVVQVATQRHRVAEELVGVYLQATGR